VSLLVLLDPRRESARPARVGRISNQHLTALRCTVAPLQAAGQLWLGIGFLLSCHPSDSLCPNYCAEFSGNGNTCAAAQLFYIRLHSWAKWVSDSGPVREYRATTTSLLRTQRSRYSHNFLAGQSLDRCPYSFSSPKFATRAVLVSFLVIFHLTPYISFPYALKLTSFSFLFGRIFDMTIFPGSFITSFWSHCCTVLQMSTFLSCRYMQELRNLQELLDSMM